MPEEKSDQSIFEKTYHYYLDQIFNRIAHLSAERLGILVQENSVIINLLNSSYTVTRDGIIDQSGESPSFDVCVIMLKYLLIDRDNYPQDKNWCSYRDLKDSKPLIHYFKTNVEDAFIKEFSGKCDQLKKACELLGGIYPQEQFSQDVSIQFNILHRVPVLLLFNDADEEFPASCSVLFERKSENYLDAECLAMVGRFLFESIANVEGGEDLTQ